MSTDNREPVYVLIPGPVTSITDGDMHFITARQLIECYKVSPTLCVVYEPKRVDAEGSAYHRQHRWKLEQLRPLKPDFYGKYEAPNRPMDARMLDVYDEHAHRADLLLTDARQRKAEKEKGALIKKVGPLPNTPKALMQMVASKAEFSPPNWPFPVVYGKVPS